MNHESKFHPAIILIVALLLMLACAFLHDATADTMYCTVTSGYLNGRLTPDGAEHTETDIAEARKEQLHLNDRH